MLEEIIRKLGQVEAIWTLDKVLVEAPKVGLQLVQSAGKRRAFRDENEQNYSFYFDNEGKIGRIEATFEIKFDLESLSPANYQHTVNYFNGQFDKALAEAARALGEYLDFRVGRDVEFPHSKDALRLALWQLDNADLMLELKHEGPDVPMRLLLTLEPKQ